MILVDHEWSIPFVSFLEYFFVFHEDSYFVFGRGEHVIPNDASVRRRLNVEDSCFYEEHVITPLGRLNNWTTPKL